MVRSLFVASLGNPAPYQRSRHSAGHLLLEAIRAELGMAPLQRHLSQGTLVLSTSISSSSSSTSSPTSTSTSPTAQLALFHSPALMNASGPAVSRAFKSFLSTLPASARRAPALVILHDELELAPGRVALRRGAKSARGHNGLRSVAASLSGSGGLDGLVRVGVGIGRPASRRPDDVAAYVLRDLSEAEALAVREAAPRVVGLLAEIAAEGGEGGEGE